MSDGSDNDIGLVAIGRLNEEPQPTANKGGDELAIEDVVVEASLKEATVVNNFIGKEDPQSKFMAALDLQCESYASLASSSSTMTGQTQPPVRRPASALYTHPSLYEAVAISPDGSLVASSGRSDVIIWDMKIGAPRHTCTLKKTAASLMFSPDSTILACGETNATIALLDVQTGSVLAILDCGAASSIGISDFISPITSMAFSPDGGSLVAAVEIKDTFGAQTWDIKEQKHLLSMSGHKAALLSVAFSPDGSCIASGAKDKTAKVWDSTTGDLIATIPQHAKGVVSVTFLRNVDRPILVTASKETISIWDARTGAQMKRMDAPFRIYSLDVFRDGGRMLVCAEKGQLCIVDIESGEFSMARMVLKKLVSNVSISPDGTFLVYGDSKDSVNLFELESKSFCATPTHPPNHWQCGKMTAFAFAPDGSRFLCTGEKAIVQLDLESSYTLAVNSDFPVPDSAFVTFSQDASLIASCEDETVKVWDTATAACLKTLTSKSPSHTNIFIVFSRDTTRLACCVSSRKSPIVWDINTGECREFPEEDDFMREALCAAFSADGRRLICGCKRGSLTVWDVEAKSYTDRWSGHTKDVKSVAVSSDDAFVASGGSDKAVKLWDAYSGECLFTLTGHKKNVTKVVFSHSSKLLLSSCHHDTMLWSVADGTCLNSFRSHGSTTAVGFTPDDMTIAYGCHNGVILTQSLQDGAPPNKHRAAFDTGDLEGGGVAAISCDGKHAVTVSYEDVLLWDCETHTCLDRLDQQAFISSIAFDQRGEFIICGLNTGKAKIWSVASRECTATLEAEKSGIIRRVAMPRWCYAITLSKTPMLKLWEEDGTCSFSYSQEITCIQCTLSTPFLALGIIGRVELWEFSEVSNKSRERQCVQTFALSSTPLDEYVSSVFFSSDGRLAVAGKSASTKAAVLALFDVKEGTFLKSVSVESWAPDQHMLQNLTILAAPTVCVVNCSSSSAVSLRSLTTLEEQARLYTQTDQVETVAFEFQAKRLIALPPPGSKNPLSFCLIEAILNATKEKPTAFLPAWYMAQLIEHDDHELLLRNIATNPASINNNQALYHDKPEKNILTILYDGGKVDLLRDVLAIESPLCHLHRSESILAHILASDHAWKDEGFDVVLSYLSARISAGKTVPGQHDDRFFDMISAALHNSSLRASAIAFFASTPLQVAPHVTSTDFNNGSAKFSETLTLATSHFKDAPGLWKEEADKDRLPAQGETNFSEFLVMPFPSVVQSSLVDSLVKLNLKELFDTIMVRSVIDYKWKQTRWGYIRDTWIYFFFLAMLSTFSVLFQQVSEDARDAASFFDPSKGTTFATMVVGILSLVVDPVYTLAQELLQMRGFGARVYFSDWWNWLDVLRVVFCVALIPLVLLDERQAAQVVLAIALYLRWFGFLFYFQAFSATGHLVRMIIQITIDIRYLLLILAMSILAASFAFNALQPASTPPAMQQQLNTILFDFFNILILNNGYEPTELVNAGYPALRIILFIVSMIFVPIILLNLLIALMSDSFERIQDQAFVELNLLRATIIKQQEYNLFNLFGGKNEKGGANEARGQERYLHVMVPKGKNQPRADLGEYQGVLNAMKRHVDSRAENLTGKVARIEGEITHLKNGIETIASAQATMQEEMNASIGALRKWMASNLAQKPPSAEELTGFNE